MLTSDHPILQIPELSLIRDSVLDKGNDCTLTRIMPLERLLALFKANNNILVSPSLWDDPYEHTHLHSKAVNEFHMYEYKGRYGPKAAFGEFSDLAIYKGVGAFTTQTSHIDSVFAQCWSKFTESDALWRIYSPDFSGIQIQVSLKSLIGSIKDTLQIPFIHYGFVMYKSDAYVSDLKRRYSQANAGATWIRKDWAELCASSLLIKRSSFQHENEFRLIVINPRHNSDKSPLFEYPLNWNSLVQKIVIDPRASKKLFDDVSLKIRSLGYSGEIKQSDLYTKQDFTLLRAIQNKRVD